jgi:hypothetical protein
MKKWWSDPSEFYIGYLPKAPASIASGITRIIISMILLAICLATLVAWHQKRFSPATFEYGTRTELEGYIYSLPIPHIVVPIGKNINDKDLYQSVLLVGFGKSGANKTLNGLLTDKERFGQKVILDGTLIYGNGKALLQIDEESTVKVLNDRMMQMIKFPLEEKLILTGEILDPKCYFGVMKPGEGKAHRSCAVRCIAGGIPPVFTSESLEYYLLMDENNEPLNEQVINVVGDHITLEGHTMVWNDWKILKVNSKFLDELVAYKKSEQNLMAFQKGMTQCN